MAVDISLVYNRFQLPLDNPSVVLAIVGSEGSSSYTYTITSFNEMGETEGVEVVTAVAPDSLGVSNYVELTWEAVPRARGYKVYRDGNLLIELSEPNYDDTGAHTPNNAINPPVVNETEFYEYDLWDRVAIVPGKFAQSAEINELQEILWHYLERLSSTFFKEGNIVSGATLNVNTDDDEVNITAGFIYIEGAIRPIKETTLAINGTGTEYIGLNANIQYVDEVDNPYLLDPAQSFPGYGSAGAYRRRILVEWATSTDPTDFDAVVWELVDGTPSLAYPRPDFGELEKTFARKIHDLHGHTLIESLHVKVFPDKVRRDKVNFEISPGKAYVEGFEITKPGKTVLNEFIAKQESSNIQEEVPVESGKLYTPDLTPLASIVQVTHRTFVTHSNTVPNNADPGQNNWNKFDLGVSVEEVEGVWNNSGKSVEYTAGTTTAGSDDFVVIGSSIYFNPGVFSPGASFYVEYQRNDTAVQGERVKTFASETIQYLTASGDTYALSPTHTDVSAPANCGDVINSVKYPVKITLDVAPFTEYVNGVDFTVTTGREGNTSIGQASITFISGNKPGNEENFVVDYYYWNHTEEGDFVYNKSYLDDTDPFQDYTYDDLDNPNQIDYRTEGAAPYTSNTDILVTYTYYLSEYAWLLMDKKGVLYVLRGRAERFPVLPHKPKGSLPRYILRFNPFSQDIIFVEEDRYEVRTTYDINVMEDRIQNIEYNNALTVLEQEALKQQTVDPKKGLFTEGFVHSSLTDLSNTTASMIYSDGKLILHRDFEPLTAKYDEDLSSNVSFRGGLITLPFTEVEYQSQLIWTEGFAQNVNPYGAYGPITNLQIFPRTDYWVVQDLTDVIISVKTTEISLGDYSVFRTSSKSIDQIKSEIKEAYKLDPTIQLYVDNNEDKYKIKYAYYYEEESSGKTFQIKSSELIPILRQIEIVMLCEGCPPNEDDISATFDDVAVNLATVNQGELNSKGLGYLTPRGTAGTTPGTMESDVNGGFIAKFTIPPNIPSGGRVVEVSSPSGLVEANDTFFGLGIVNHMAEYKQTTKRKYLIKLTFYSPLAESFIVNDDVFISSIDLWVYRVPVADNGGLKVAIRGMDDGGQPNNVEYGTAFLSKAQIKTAMGIVSDSSPLPDIPSDSNKCTFTFDRLVHLRPGTYCFTIEDQAPGYFVYTSRLGRTILGKVDDETYPQKGELLKIQPFGGVMFISANNQSWELEQEADILFRLNRANFNTGVTGIVKNTLSAPSTDKSHFAHIADYEVPEDCVLYSMYEKNDTSKKLYLPIQGKDPNGSFEKENPDDLIALGEMQSALDLEIELQSGNSFVSPYIEQFFNYVYAYHYDTSSVYRHIEVSDAGGFDNIKVWIDELIPASGTITYEISFDSGSNWYTLPSIGTVALDTGYTERELGGVIDTITSSAVSTATDFIIRITLANDVSARYETPSNRRLRVVWY